MTIKWRVLLFSMAFMLSACGLAEGTIPTSRPPTITPTKISTPLPYVPTEIPAGFNEENAIQIVVVPVNSAVASQRFAEFESALQALTDVSISVILAESDDEAYATVCASDQGIISAAWLEGMSFVANTLSNCGIGVLQAETEAGTGTTGVMLLNIVPEEGEEGEEGDEPAEGTFEQSQEEEIENLELFASAEGVVCRIGVDDLYSWTLPVLYYGTEGISPADLVEVVDVNSNDTLIADLESGDCDVAGMSQADWEAYLEADEDGSLADAVEVIVTSPEIPFKVFSFSSALSLEAIADIEDALLQMEYATGRSEPTAEATEDPDANFESTFDSALLEAFFGEAILIQLDDERINELFSLFNANSVDFSELSN